MAKRKSPDKEPNRQKKWDKVFNALVRLSQNLQKDRQLLEGRIKSLHEVIYKMKMEQKVDSMKTELMLGLKEREAFIYKHRYEDADSELADFREWFDYLSQNCSAPKNTSGDVSGKGEGGLRNKALQDEVRKLKSGIEKCKLEKNSEISALLEEKNFVWNQLKIMENDYSKQLKKKCDEVDHANEKVQILVDQAEELQISNERLRTDFANMKSESVQKSEEISRLLKEIEVLKSRSSGSASPSLRSFGAEQATASQKGGKNGTTVGRVIAVKKELDSSGKMGRAKPSAHKSTGGKAPRKQFTTKGSSSGSKRKAADVITIPDTPKLFTSSFKVPKLKSSSSPQIV
ncbi:hypothetical protein CDL12_18269 [Handroanthus impetiginosus]|uniref:Uncharacterized protein n=1 Tax=Handroanthus impetiginosus TaxID=429701 RepID=A0A2G9GV28_9LAMI|nr:hypothetical protein CDL12_18269 [Handroanthus impetiginosus]